MSKLYIPDICAHLDRLKRLCDRLEKAQSDEQRYRELVQPNPGRNRGVTRDDLQLAARHVARACWDLMQVSIPEQ